MQNCFATVHQPKAREVGNGPIDEFLLLVDHGVRFWLSANHDVWFDQIVSSEREGDIPVFTGDSFQSRKMGILLKSRDATSLRNKELSGTKM
jgi:hypothetical protein